MGSPLSSLSFSSGFLQVLAREEEKEEATEGAEVVTRPKRGQEGRKNDNCGSCAEIGRGIGLLILKASKECF